MHSWQIKNCILDLSIPKIMGILNVTPDSFSDGGEYFSVEKAVERAKLLQTQGADILDVGAESTRPGSAPLAPEEEWQRLEPVLTKMIPQLEIPISVDTRHGTVARKALECGVEIINDISGGQDLELLQTVAEFKAGYVLMHMRGTPQTMTQEANYASVIEEVRRELSLAWDRVIAAGISPEHICIDPGFGFAKDLEHNYELLLHLNQIRIHDRPILAGLSRKRLLQALVGEGKRELDQASTMASLLAIQNGAQIVRLHEVQNLSDILSICT